ncbi:MAG: hypothetical protein OHK0029_00500 [Armatimonadaceae bacterium]
MIATVPGPETRDVRPESVRDREGHYLSRIRQLVSGENAEKQAQQALAALERGNRAPHLYNPHYEQSVPRYLLAVWNYTAWINVAWEEFARFRELARATLGYASFAATERRNIGEAERAHRAVVALGERLVGNWPLSEGKGDFGILRTLVGIAIVSMSLNNRERIFLLAGKTVEREAALRDEQAFRAKVTEYKKVLNEQWFTPSAAFNMLNFY